jgi:hypothetical protein
MKIVIICNLISNFASNIPNYFPDDTQAGAACER